MRDTLPFIEETKSRPLDTLSVGRHVLVIGAGNSAIDAATAAGRLGAESVTIVYRRSEEEIPCYGFEFGVRQAGGRPLPVADGAEAHPRVGQGQGETGPGTLTQGPPSGFHVSPGGGTAGGLA